MRGGLAVWRGVAGGAAGELGDRLGFAEHEALGDQKALSRGGDRTSKGRGAVRTCGPWLTTVTPRTTPVRKDTLHVQ